MILEGIKMKEEKELFYRNNDDNKKAHKDRGFSPEIFVRIFAL